ncbi:hypothetical protein ACTI_75240 [Actinoplanes sp. OR16]|uniref:WXG100-like domain-containing protein n=1 Tax=Actinoplanes sp. OR16 TaxID=946334 RepID=UPI000F70F49F|nr:hypothetical protein [Actinoplanes sp. OR16]BBH70839.1 hypothetical protein ACTI_75240 [Actinoplanes sp. OR16]
MSIRLPGELAGLLNELGYSWPESDEDQLIDAGRDWLRLAGVISELQEDIAATARQVVGDNTAQSIDAFLTQWQADDGSAATLARGDAGAIAVGGGLTVCAGVVLALKINVLVQLTVLAASIIQAIVTAVPTAGASLLEIPVVKQLTGVAINFLIEQATDAVLG